jgi:hypothetical protein
MDDNKEKTEAAAAQGRGISKKILAIFVVGVIVFAGGMAWWVSGFIRQSAEQTAKQGAGQANLMEKMISQNPRPRDLAEPPSGTITYVIDATAKDKWVHFSFSKLAKFTGDKLASDSDEWDIVFRRAKILTNGGASGKKGMAEVTIAVGAGFDSVMAPPEAGWAKDQTTANFDENMNPALDKWYLYDFWTHKLKPRDEVYALKTANGDFVKLQLLDYYCGSASGCYTIKYAFLGGATGKKADAAKK